MAFGILFLDRHICRDLKNKFSPQESSVNVKHLSKWFLDITFLRWHVGMLDGKSGFITLLQGWILTIVGY